MTHCLIVVFEGKRSVFEMPSCRSAFGVAAAMVRMKERKERKLDGDYVAYQRLPIGMEVTG